MHHQRFTIATTFVSIFLAGATVVGQSTMAPTTKPAARPAMKNIADEPAPKMRAGQVDKHFAQMHESFLKRGKAGKIGVLFLGDSITEGWGRAKKVWEEHYGKDDPANFGIGGDRTEHVLWRIDNGELDGISPKVLVLMIGTNNSGSNTAAQITKADDKIIDEIHQKLPDTKILVLGIFPRGHDPKDPKVAAVRAKIDSVNKELATLDGTKNVTYLDIGPKFLDADGMIQPDIMKDFLHPTAKGYEIWADAMQPTLDKLMN